MRKLSSSKNQKKNGVSTELAKRLTTYARVAWNDDDQPLRTAWSPAPPTRFNSNVTEARQRSVAENKPILIFTAADGSPLGRT